MTTLADLIERTRNAARDRPNRDTFTGTVLSGDSAVTFLNGDKIPVGGIIDTAKFETMRVLTKPTVTTATLERAIEGTTASGYSAGDDVYIGFRYSYAAYRRAINNALAAISLMFGNPTWDTASSFGKTTLLYSVPATAIRVFDVAYVPSNVTKLKSLPYEFKDPVPTSLIASGKAIELAGSNPGTGTVYVGYEKAWTTLSLAADVLDSAYPGHGEDCIILGALSYLQDEEAFRRTAFDSPHGRQQVFAASVQDVDNASRENLQRFLMRRAELAALVRRVNTTWVKG